MIILTDTREKPGHRWSFGEIETITKKLDTGDYSLLGFEDVVCIERKKSVSEIAINLGSDCKRFNKELERMKLYKYAYIICEFTLEALMGFPYNCSIPKSQLSKIRINAKYLVKRMSSMYIEYGINVIYCTDKNEAISQAIEIFNKVENNG